MGRPPSSVLFSTICRVVSRLRTCSSVRIGPELARSVCFKWQGANSLFPPLRYFASPLTEREEGGEGTNLGSFVRSLARRSGAPRSLSPLPLRRSLSPHRRCSLAIKGSKRRRRRNVLGTREAMLPAVRRSSSEKYTGDYTNKQDIEGFCRNYLRRTNANLQNTPSTSLCAVWHVGKKHQFPSQYIQHLLLALSSLS